MLLITSILFIQFTAQLYFLLLLFPLFLLYTAQNEILLIYFFVVVKVVTSKKLNSKKILESVHKMTIMCKF